MTTPTPPVTPPEPIRMTVSMDELFKSFSDRHRAALLERCAKSSVAVCPQSAQDSYLRDIGMVYDWLTDLFDGKCAAMIAARGGEE